MARHASELCPVPCLKALPLPFHPKRVHCDVYQAGARNWSNQVHTFLTKISYVCWKKNANLWKKLRKHIKQLSVILISMAHELDLGRTV